MKQPALILAFLITVGIISGCSQQQDNDSRFKGDLAVPRIEGFKEAKFGARLDEMESLGFYCLIYKPDVVGGEPSTWHNCTKDSTLFGLPARVEAQFDEHILRSVEVLAVDSKPIDLVSLYTNAMGPPREFEERSPHDLTTRHTSWWLAPNGTGVAITRYLYTQEPLTPIKRELANDGAHLVDGAHGARYEQRVWYYNEDDTSKRIGLAQAGQVEAPDDF